MKAIIHPGIAKCGSTSLQRSLHQASKQLSGSGVLYSALDDFSANPLVMDYLPRSRVPREYRTAPDEDFQCGKWFAAVSEQIVSSAPKTLLLSGESLAWCLEELSQELVERADAIEIICYFRMPISSWALSSYQQEVKASCALPSEKWFKRRLSHWISPFRNAAALASEHPNITFRPRIYNRLILVNGCVVQDFLETAGLASAIDEIEQAVFNDSLSAEGCALLWDFRKHVIGGKTNDLFDPRSDNLIKSIHAAEKKMPNLTKLAFKEDIVGPIEAASIDAYSEVLDSDLFATSEAEFIRDLIGWARLSTAEWALTYRDFSDAITFDHDKLRRLTALVLSQADQPAS